MTTGQPQPRLLGALLEPGPPDTAHQVDAYRTDLYKNQMHRRTVGGVAKVVGGNPTVMSQKTQEMLRVPRQQPASSLWVMGSYKAVGWGVWGGTEQGSWWAQWRAGY